jgi:hypothetical protein
LLNDQWVIEKIIEKISLEVNENENTTYQNLWDTSKAISYTHLIFYKGTQNIR